MNHQHFQGQDALSFAMNGQEPYLSETVLVDTHADSKQTELADEHRTWNWKEAADVVGINESTLRRRWWEDKLENAFRHSPKPLRVVTRTMKSGRQLEEFTTYGIEVLKAYKAALAVGDRAAELLLAEAKAKYPAPTDRSATYRSTPQTVTPAVTPEVMPSERSADEEFDEFYVPMPNVTIVPTRKIKMPNTADDFDFGSALVRLGGNQGLAVSDSKRLVDAAEKLLNGMAAALEQKVDQQAESLHSDLAQLQRLEETKLDFLRRTSFAARQAKDLASRQTEVTEELTTTYHEIASLGKPLADRRASGQ
jgi:hypothetical protein